MKDAPEQTTVGEATAEDWQEELSAAYLEERVATLFDAIAHGSDEHRAWLKKAIDDHFASRQVESAPLSMPISLVKDHRLGR